MHQDELEAALVQHREWLGDNQAGKQLDLSRANLTRADLPHADLTAANLTHAKLSAANLAEANLEEANLAGAHLTYANLTDANLAYANLAYTNLAYANLSGAKLNSAIGNCREVKSLHIHKYIVTYTHDRLFIGCHGALIEDWFNYTDEELSKIAADAASLWKRYREVLAEIIRLSPAKKP